MNSRERLTAIFKKQEIDRPALKLWGATPGQQLIHPAYAPVYELAMETTDLMVSESSPNDILLGWQGQQMTETSVTPGPENWEDVTTVYHTPMGDLRAIYRRSTLGLPGYDLEHPVKDEHDMEALLSIPYEPYAFSMDSFLHMDSVVGDRGICMYSLDNTVYVLHRIMGSETFAILNVEAPELLAKAAAEYARRIRLEAERVFDAGCTPVFGWVGPEICIPPLMSPASFEAYVMRYDKPLCDYIHERGGHVWLHCHNKVGNMIDRFIHMGIDVLNPLEPPPMGNCILSDLVAKYGNTIGLEGNIETHDLWSATPQRLEELVKQAVADGAGSGRFILCPSAGYMEFPNPTARYIENLMGYLSVGYAEVMKHQK